MNQTLRHSVEAFTLLELILVLVLVAVLTTLATPALRGFARRAALDDTAASMLTLTQQAGTRAVHEAAPYRIVFDVNERRAWLEHVGHEGYEAVDSSAVEPVVWGNTVTLVSDIQQNGYGQYVIEFEPTGLVTPGSIVIEQDDKCVALSCDAATERYRLVTLEASPGRHAEGVLDAMRL